MTVHRFFDREAKTIKTRANLPHWFQPGVVLFVTFRLADSIPKEKLKLWTIERDAWLAQNPPPHTSAQATYYQKTFKAGVERWLDAGHGACLFERPDLAGVVGDCLCYGDGVRYLLGPCVVAMNHVHLLLAPQKDWTLSKIMQAIKSVSAHQLNMRLGRNGVIWQKESFDHLVRSETSLTKFEQYILSHRGYFPKKAW